jgi:transcriptional regulator with XRE-family HTH domain
VLAANVKRAREARGMSLMQLARATGNHISTISNIERGTATDPRISTIEAIARVLGVSIADLLDGSEAEEAVIKQ